MLIKEKKLGSALKNNKKRISTILLPPPPQPPNHTCSCFQCIYYN